MCIQMVRSQLPHPFLLSLPVFTLHPPDKVQQHSTNSVNTSFCHFIKKVKKPHKDLLCGRSQTKDYHRFYQGHAWQGNKTWFLYGTNKLPQFVLRNFRI